MVGGRAEGSAGRPRALVLLALLGAAVPGHAADRAECADLIRQYDVAAPAHHAASHAPDAERERAAGAQACRAGRYAEGVEALRRALHDIGVKPVRLAPVKGE